MKKRAKQLAMLGLTVTMMCGTQMTAFASGLGEEAPVAIETEAKDEKESKTVGNVRINCNNDVWYTDDSICIRFRRRSTSCY